jgi:16S rRNA (guanine527-N7)-methyltransferase
VPTPGPEPVDRISTPRSALLEGARLLGVELAPGQLARFDRFGAALREANREVNLTRITDPVEVETKHFLDSLTAAVPLLDRLRAGEAVRLVDVGAGAGLPGLALKIAFPRIRVALVESIGKKARFLRRVVAELELDEVEVVQERAETAARDPSHRDGYGWATARALGSLPVVIELTAPFLEPGGLLVAQRRGDLDAETLAAARAFAALKMWARLPVPIHLPGLDDGRGLVVGEKYGSTPARYPRRPGLPAKRPLA